MAQGPVLGIESTAHTASVGVVLMEVDTSEGGVEVLSNRFAHYSPPEGGIHPREAANHHAEALPRLIQEALEEAGLRANGLSGVAFAQGPGLGPCLRTGASAARALALTVRRPLVGVNHCVAHLEIGRAVLGCTDPVLLYASGGNTQVIAYAAGRYRVFGETLDIGMGNMLDKLGREMGMPFPSGPHIETMAIDGERLLDLPYSVKGMDVAFSGMLTAAVQQLARGADPRDMSMSVQETAFAMLVEVTERAMAHVGRDEVLLGGGVAANARLREMVNVMAEERGASSFVPPRELCIDNGAMIAVLGSMMMDAGATTSLEGSGVRQRFRTDEVEVTWR
jgi:N6-L-threonylcarbamoyladenine synthase/N6-L-threonylcarbamoyladenine synthase/protein kinase Bud32